MENELNKFCSNLAYLLDKGVKKQPDFNTL